MKNYILMLLVFFIFSSLNAYSSSEVFESLEVDEDGDPTGYTKVYELEWISQDTLQITTSERASSVGDVSFLYNETQYTMTNTMVICEGDTLEKSTIHCGNNTKFIPFDDSGYYMVEEISFGCKCMAIINCGATVDKGCRLSHEPRGYICDKTELFPCSGDCIRYHDAVSGGSSSHRGFSGGILINAEYVIIVAQ